MTVHQYFLDMICFFSEEWGKGISAFMGISNSLHKTQFYCGSSKFVGAGRRGRRPLHDVIFRQMVK